MNEIDSYIATIDELVEDENKIVCWISVCNVSRTNQRKPTSVISSFKAVSNTDLFFTIKDLLELLQQQYLK